MKAIIGLLALLIACDKPVPPSPTVIIQVVKPTVDERKEAVLTEYHSCMDETQIRFHKIWDAQCIRVEHKKPDCILETDQASLVVAKVVSLKQDCQNDFNNKIQLIQ